MKQYAPIAIGVVVGAIIAAIFLWNGGDETEAIRKELEKLTEQVEKQGKESPIQLATTAKTIAGYVTEDVEFTMPRVGSVDGRERVQGGALSARSAFETIEIILKKVDIELDSSELGASSVVTVRVKASGPGQNVDETGRFFINWLKIEGRWLISSVQPDNG